jgi:hypothetical protein
MNELVLGLAVHTRKHERLTGCPSGQVKLLALCFCIPPVLLVAVPHFAAVVLIALERLQDAAFHCIAASAHPRFAVTPASGGAVV